MALFLIGYFWSDICLWGVLRFATGKPTYSYGTVYSQHEFIFQRRQDPNNYSDTETRALSIHDPTSAAQAVSHALRNPKIKVQSNLLSTQLV